MTKKLDLNKLAIAVGGEVVMADVAVAASDRIYDFMNKALHDAILDNARKPKTCEIDRVDFQSLTAGGKGIAFGIMFTMKQGYQLNGGDHCMVNYNNVNTTKNTATLISADGKEIVRAKAKGLTFTEVANTIDSFMEFIDYKSTKV